MTGITKFTGGRRLEIVFIDRNLDEDHIRPLFDKALFAEEFEASPILGRTLLTVAESSNHETALGVSD